MPPPSFRCNTGYMGAVIAERHIVLFIVREIITAVIQSRQFAGEFRMGKNGVVDNADGDAFSSIASGIGKLGGNSLKPPLAVKLGGFQLSGAPSDRDPDKRQEKNEWISHNNPEKRNTLTSISY